MTEKTTTGILRVKSKSGGKYLVEVEAKKGGRVPLQVSQKAVGFFPDDAVDGVEVSVVLVNGQPTRVTIPGKREKHPAAEHVAEARPPARDQRHDNHRQPAGKATPDILGHPFHNPYTFIPFPDEPPSRKRPTPLTADEAEQDRYTGIIDIEVTTLSPLKSCAPTPVAEQPKGHNFYQALRIGDDVIVPATGIKGAIRSLLTILTGGTLSYIDDEAYLCQARDLRLGPRVRDADTNVPRNVFLAEIIKPTSGKTPTQVRLGDTVLVRADEIESVGNLKLQRPDAEHRSGAPLWIGIADDRDGQLAHVERVSTTRSNQTSWRVKLSGRPVDRAGQHKKEGAFLGSDKIIDLPQSIWREFEARHMHADNQGELHGEELVWLEPKDPDCKTLNNSEQVKSIQLARWGREGSRLIDRVPQHVYPDWMQSDGPVDEVTGLFQRLLWRERRDSKSDGLVDEVTGLFGQIDSASNKAPTFAARIRPENLVFDGSKTCNRILAGTVLPPLGMPHPGCLAFYREGSAENVSADSYLRGYKVYRTTNESGQNAPWHHAIRNNKNQTCDLLDKDAVGTLRIAFRSLAPRELALLHLVCSVPWRLGGGKPLGLGRCKVEVLQLRNELGQVIEFADWRQLIDPEILAKRLPMWTASQEPVAKLRYPRAERNGSLGGHIWFSRFATPDKTCPDGSDKPRGLQPVQLVDELKRLAGTGRAEGQMLPELDTTGAGRDFLYGYDLKTKKVDGTLGTSGPPRTPDDRGGPNTRAGQNRDTRRSVREERTEK
jgi:hypothetical protein